MANAASPYRLREYSFITPAEFPDAAEYRYLCRVAGLPPTPGGYGLLHVLDPQRSDSHVTLVSDDVMYVRLLAATPSSVLAGMEIPGELEKFKARPGWPDEWVKPPRHGRPRRKRR